MANQLDVNWGPAQKVIDAAGKPPTGETLDLALLRIMSYAEAAAFMGLSRVTLERLVATKRGPPMIRLSARRCGFRVIDVVRWLDSRKAA